MEKKLTEHAAATCLSNDVHRAQKLNQMVHFLQVSAFIPFDMIFP